MGPTTVGVPKWGRGPRHHFASAGASPEPTATTGVVQVEEARFRLEFGAGISCRSPEGGEGQEAWAKGGGLALILLCAHKQDDLPLWGLTLGQHSVSGASNPPDSRFSRSGTT